MIPFKKCPVCGGEMVEKEVEKLLRGGVHTAVVKVHAEVRYSRLIASVATYLGIPDEETVSVLMGVHETEFVVE